MRKETQARISQFKGNNSDFDVCSSLWIIKSISRAVYKLIYNKPNCTRIGMAKCASCSTRFPAYDVTADIYP